ncbi:MAG TPA: glycosyltransferase family 2 protein [Nocardioides sp.]|jgi:CDP-glycerol glycerophosphotransferase|nr:glycosyltransferase family 2 protein [Nocardioides sp.]
MRLARRHRPEVGVVVPAYGVEEWLPHCLESLTAQRHRAWTAVVVDDGSPDRSGEIAEEFAARDDRIRVLHTENRGLGAARNEGLRHLDTDYVAFLDSDDMLPPTAYADMVGRLEASGSDFVAASFQLWDDGELAEPRWMRRLHHQLRSGIGADEHPEILGDVFAWDKLFRRSFWDAAGLAWPEGIHYEDQPCTTAAYLRGRFDVVPDHVYHWRIRADGTSITQQRASVGDLGDRLESKRQSLALVHDEGSPELREVFVDRVMAGDLWRYFLELPRADDEWWKLLRAGIEELWGERSLVHSGLMPVHRLIGWLVQHDRRDEATAVAAFLNDGGAVPRTPDGVALDTAAIPGLDAATIDRPAVELRPHELRKRK